mmetsp:Transcript_1855/g.4179  ORF Transcript_1855/g.4179 Transcript_1855/m.4179 type:complete len:275 (+) Transcript_1855:41-865(+)
MAGSPKGSNLLAVPGQGRDSPDDSPVVIRPRSKKLQERLTQCSIMSQQFFHKPQEVMIVLDWDDTVLPTSWLREAGRSGQPLKLRHLKKLSQVEQQAKTFLKVATEVGSVVIVTNAKRGWVQNSCERFIPGLAPSIKDLPVVYARPESSETAVNPNWDETTMLGWKEESMYTKISEFYGKGDRSWKNVVTIGDSDWDMEALMSAVKQRPTRGACRCKFLKLPQDPDAEHVDVNLNLLSQWLPVFVAFDGDLEVDFAASEDELADRLQELFEGGR